MALSAARSLFESKNEDGGVKTKSVLMANATTIYKGSYVMRNAAGVCVPAAIAAANKGIVGIALETVTASDATTYVKVQFGGPFLVVCSGLAQANEGDFLYADDDETGLDAGDATTNAPSLGMLMEYVSATQGWVFIDPRANALNGVA